MGKRVHVVSIREEYGDSSVFNWKQEEFKNVLFALDCEVHESDECGYSDRFEVVTDEFETAMENLDAFINGTPMSDACNKDDVEECLSNFGYDEGVMETAKYVMECMKNLYEERDKDSDWMIFVSW